MSRLQPDIEPMRDRLASGVRRLRVAMSHAFERGDARVHALHQQMQHLDPQQVLARGYSLVRDAAGNIVRSSAAIETGDCLRLTFAEGGAKVEVREKQR